MALLADSMTVAQVVYKLQLEALERVEAGVGRKRTVGGHPQNVRIHYADVQKPPEQVLPLASDSVRLMKLLRSLYSISVILGFGLQFDRNDLLTITSNVNLNLYNPNPPN